MASGTNIKTWFEGTWHNGDVPVMRAADHGAWLGTNVFDGARYAHGVAPDLLAHCERVNASARAFMIEPTHTPEDMVAIVEEGLACYPKAAAVYIRPMYWAIDSGPSVVLTDPGRTGFAICLEEIPLAPPDATVTLARTRFRRPTLDSAVVNAKAGALYPNNARMLAEVQVRGFQNALVADAMGNVAETATSNVFMVRDGEIMTPVPNGTFLAGITRARHIANLAAEGERVTETVLTFEDFEVADEVFVTGNMHKITPVTAFEDTTYQPGPVALRLREMYWDWALSGR
ncbi:MAG: branched-chain amino acid aminotransferase [Paracoccaceae bacterium]|nr:branched-chain amino acid aminotransferase [Paracoccaceae bacterium]